MRAIETSTNYHNPPTFTLKALCRAHVTRRHPTFPHLHFHNEGKKKQLGRTSVASATYR